MGIYRNRQKKIEERKRMGSTLINNTFPKIAKQLERIADALELRNQVDALIRAKQLEEEEFDND